MSSRFLVALKATRTSAFKVVGILLVLKATVDKNVNSHCGQDSDSSESYSYRVEMVADPLERDILNVAGPHVRGNNVMYCVVDPQVIEM